MKLFIQKLKQSQGEPVLFQEKVDISDLTDLENDIRRIDPVQVEGTARMDGEDIACDFQIKGTMILPCARTLVDVPYNFVVHAIESFTTTSYHQEEEVHLVNGEVLDLTPFIKENVLLEMPIRVFADQNKLDANTLTEGNGWTLVTEQEQSEKVDPRLEKLKSLLDDNSNEDNSKE
ncbi:YceD family protein [Gracilibacillus caseinilyticus]|uniref:YceD family protein n=1 Tax=Gracilibacillus caseinilyticus TaxID=2932256 RepID=A0ABY4EVU1_9BACI|nr:YceD family protein [Gracilibacillus caseinilyticus]UOQ47972.1 YceD family protein [Gracilibacillus caseinilyticus]